jgi:hypothetical protein
MARRVVGHVTDFEVGAVSAPAARESFGRPVVLLAASTRIAPVFSVQRAWMASRAKRRIRDAGIPSRCRPVRICPHGYPPCSKLSVRPCDRLARRARAPYADRLPTKLGMRNAGLLDAEPEAWGLAVGHR